MSPESGPQWFGIRSPNGRMSGRAGPIRAQSPADEPWHPGADDDAEQPAEPIAEVPADHEERAADEPPDFMDEAVDTKALSTPDEDGAVG